MKKVAAKLVRYIYDDLTAKYGLAEEASVTVTGEGVGIGTCETGVLRIDSKIGGSAVTLTASPFPADSKLWNGPNVLPDGRADGSMEMSLWHDLIWYYAKEIAQKLGMTEQDVMKWGNGILHACYIGYGKKRGKDSAWFAKIAYKVCEFSRKWWRMIFVVALWFAAAGCGTPPDWVMGHSTDIVIGEPHGDITDAGGSD